MASFTEFVDSLDADAGKRGKQFEHFVKWFLKNDPEWASQIDTVWLWQEYPDRWGVDCGIDLVFRHRSGETWAVQAKCYSALYDITKNDVDRFLSESNRKGIDKRLLIATTDRLGANAKQVCEAQDKQVVRYLRSNFETANVQYPATIGELHKAKRKDKPQPRDHQREAIAAVLESFQGGERGQLIMACGTGKTFTTLWIKERLGANSTLILLPSLGLLSQTLHEWTLAANQPFDVLCVCSDDTVGKRGSDESIHSVTELPFPVTSNTTEIRSFLMREGPKVVFSTYQSSPLVADAQSVDTVPEFDLIVADEAHRCAGKVGSDFTLVLDAKRIRGKRRLFATATPRTYSTAVKSAAEGRRIEVVGMDDEAVFGKVLYSLPFGEAIKRELLTDYRVVIIGVDNPTIAAWIENRELLKTDTGIEIDAESLAAQIGLLKAFKDYDLHRVISFHSRVSRAESFAADLNGVANWVGSEHKPSGVLKTDFVSGAMATDKRRRKLGQLKGLGTGERGLLANARCLSEGVDVPSLDGVAFIDPRGSQIDIIQAVGRAIRLSANKTAGTIVLPVFIEDGASPEESIEASNFKPIWDVLSALKAHDDVLSAEMDQLRTEMGRKAGLGIGPDALAKIHIDLPASVDHSFTESLRTYLVERVTDSWEYWFGLLNAYVADTGDSRVKSDYQTPNGKLLGRWVAHQRDFKNTLSIHRIYLLETLPKWTWNPLQARWEEAFSKLTQYCEKYGDCLVPAKFQLSDGFKLGLWVSGNRLRKNALDGDSRQRLERLRGWSWSPIIDQWENGYSSLKNFSFKHGHARIPGTWVDDDGFRLGGWVATQRSSKGKLMASQIARLEKIDGWVWEAQVAKWNNGFEYLAKYAASIGNARVPDEYVATDGFELGTWVGSQRRKRANLDSARAKKLESLPGWTWNAMEERWLQGFQYLKEYSARNGDSLVPAKYRLEDGFPLGNWVSQQRLMPEKIPEDRKRQLEQIKGWSWTPHEDSWENGFRHLVEFSKLYGSGDVPTAFVSNDGYKLGAWVGGQRSNRTRLTVERVARLESVAGWIWRSKSYGPKTRG